MIITVEGLQVEVPEKYVEEYLGLMQCSREYLADYLQYKAEVFKEDLVFNHEFFPKTFQKDFAEFLNADLDIFRC